MYKELIDIDLEHVVLVNLSTSENPVTHFEPANSFLFIKFLDTDVKKTMITQCRG